MKKTISMLSLAAVAATAFGFKLSDLLVDQRPARGTSCRVRERRVPRVALPRPGEGHVETEYLDKVAMPFYKRHIVDSCHVPKKMSKKDARKLRRVREALARHLATGLSDFPTAAEADDAHALWRAKCRDAAVAVVHYLCLGSDDRYWKGPGIFRDAAARHDFEREPVLGFILRAYALGSARHHVNCDSDAPREPVAAADAECVKAFGPAAFAYKEADRRILERFSERISLPEGVLAEFGDEYLTLCQHAEDFMDKAFDSRGQDWACKVTDEGWEGWGRYNEMAESNLLAAVALRPEESRAPMLLSSLAGRSCSSSGDPVEWCSMAISNSLDRCAESIDGFLHFRTSRWGGSTAMLRSFLLDCATNVDVRSTFSYHAAATALRKMLIAEVDGENQTGAFARVADAEVSAALYAMFDAYAAAPESRYMPSPDVFRGMGMSLAIQLKDWKTVRRYWKSLSAPLRSYRDAAWLRRTCSPAGDDLANRYVFKILGQSRRAEEFLAGLEAISEGRHEDAFAAFAALQEIEKPSDAEKFLAGDKYFAERRLVQDAAGGWVDVMPTASGGEAQHFWGITVTDKDGWARISNKKEKRGYYRVLSSLPGLDAEYEAKVRFERNDKKQKTWNIGWGFARPFSGFCVENSAWAFPYILFTRDEKGDRYAVESFTPENEDNQAPKDGPDGRDVGSSPERTVARGILETADEHSFSLRVERGTMTISIDGKEVFSDTVRRMMSVSANRDRIQPDGSVLPVWKLFRNTAFTGYRYRRIPRK